MTTATPVKWVNTRVSRELHERMKAAARAEHRSLSVWLAQAVERALAETGAAAQQITPADVTESSNAVATAAQAAKLAKAQRAAKQAKVIRKQAKVIRRAVRLASQWPPSPPGAKFCTACGTPLASEDGNPESPADGDPEPQA